MVKRKKVAPADEAPADRGKRIGVRVPEEVRKALETLAADDGRDLSGYVRRVLSEHVKGASGGSRKRAT